MELKKRNTAALTRRIDHTVTVLGDSMLPDFAPGEVYHYIPTNEVLYDGIYVIVVDGCQMVKQVQRFPGGILRVSSINKRYTPFEIEESNPAIQIRGHNLHIGARSDILFRPHR